MPNLTKFVVVCRNCGGGPTNIVVNYVPPQIQFSINCVRCSTTESHMIMTAPINPTINFVPNSNTVEKQEEPMEELVEEKAALSPKAKLMKTLIEKKDLKALGRNKKKLNDQEYLYVKEIIERSLQQA